MRRLLENEVKDSMVYVDKDWYSSLTEQYTHVTPNTKPNLHNDHGLPYAGGILQPAGLALSLDVLATVLTFAALPICRYFKLDDLLKELS